MQFLRHWVASKPSCLSFTTGVFPYCKITLDPENLILIGREKTHAFVFIYKILSDHLQDNAAQLSITLDVNISTGEGVCAV